MSSGRFYTQNTDDTEVTTPVLLRRTFSLEEGQIVDGQAENETDVDAVKRCVNALDGRQCQLLPVRAAELLFRQRVLAAISPPARDSTSGSRYKMTIPTLVWSALLQTFPEHRRTRAAWCAAVRRFSPSATALSTSSSAKKTRPCNSVPSCPSIASTPQLCKTADVCPARIPCPQRFVSGSRPSRGSWTPGASSTSAEHVVSGRSVAQHERTRHLPRGPCGTSRS